LEPAGTAVAANKVHQGSSSTRRLSVHFDVFADLFDGHGMKDHTPAFTGRHRKRRLYHGTRAELRPGDLIEPGTMQDADASGARYVYCPPEMDAAIWAAELAQGDGTGRVYTVEATGDIQDTSSASDPPSHPRMSWRSSHALRVMAEVTEWALYHGTRADLMPGDLIRPGHSANFGSAPRLANYVYVTRTLDAATWGAELADGEGPGRIYIVEATGSLEDDPNLTDQRFRGNPTKSFRSREPVRVIGEVTNWKGHAPAAIQSMKENLTRLEEHAIEPMDD
jgi:hypothetical protein